MVLLASGGHCLLALVKSVDEFHLLGDSDNNAPGEIMDKVFSQNRGCEFLLKNPSLL